MRNPKTGAYQREGRWQIMIHGESYKPIVAEAAKKSADEVFNRICVTHLLMDESKENRVAGAVGFNVRTGNYHVFKSKTVICRCRWRLEHLSSHARLVKVRVVSGMRRGHRAQPMVC